jgi:hypothetical protein
MDEIKDIQKNDDLGRFINAQNVRTDPFGKNRAAERLYRRVERICAAIHLLTRHIPIGEPIREQIRLGAILLFAQVLDLKDEMRAMESNAIANFESSVRKQISFVRILTAAGFISFQNADAVIAALDELGTFVSASQRTNLSEGIVFTREEFMGDTSPLGDKYFIKDIRDRRYLKDNTVIKDNTNGSGFSKTTAITARAQSIVSILQVGGELGIRDICSRLPDYSEKMIQRELAVLTKEGRIKKEGFKRWSRYSLVS